VGFLRVGTIYRYARPYDDMTPERDGLPNYFAHTASQGPKPLLEKGISPIGICRTVDGTRTPAILIASSPHKIGSEGTPWHDIYDADNGFVRYFGDNKSETPASQSPGNKAIIQQFELHNSGDRAKRLQATPFLFFERVTVDSRPKGNIRFWGAGVIRSAELVTQFQAEIGYFTNYVFEFTILDLSTENESFNWDWIEDRRSESISNEKSLTRAPKSWKKWIESGELVIERNRRQVSKFALVKKQDQLPVAPSREANCLEKIYAFYTNNNSKHKFEMLASRVAQSVLARDGIDYKNGWVTNRSGDGGVDFVARIDLGHGFAKLKLVVLGQAKCESPKSATSGLDIARTVARLKRGWIGVYVTTSYFSEKAQIEIVEDQFPLITINGKQVAEEVLKLMDRNGFSDVETFLKQVEVEYDAARSTTQSRTPEEILLD
jgi:hypothetical protein